MRRKGEVSEGVVWTLSITGGMFLLCLLVGGGCYGYPQYQVYSARLHGEAQLAEAESSRKVQIADAHGKEEAAKSLAGAEIERAKGVAEANRIIGMSLKDNPEYLTYLWIKEVNADGNSVIYIPTEAGIPILEAGRQINRQPPPKKVETK